MKNPLPHPSGPALTTIELLRLSTMRPVSTILADIDAFSPNDGDWRKLDNLLGELWNSGVEETHLITLFGVFECYPDDEGSGVLWSIVHGLEALPFEYEAKLRDSFSRHPSFMGKVMLQRLDNSRRA